jgi:hypothetical protein
VYLTLSNTDYYLLSIIPILFGSGILLALIRAIFGVATFKANMDELKRSHGELKADVTSLRESVDWIKSYLVSRGRVESLHRGWTEMHSPLHITPAGMEVALPLLAELVPLYLNLVKNRQPEMSDDAFDALVFQVFESSYRDRIIEQICIPTGVNLGACLIALLEACKVQGATLEDAG